MLLVPVAEADLLANLTRRVAVEGWVVTAERPVAELEDGYAEARDVLRLVLAGRRPAGVYTITDVLVEHAITTNELANTDTVHAWQQRMHAWASGASDGSELPSATIVEK